MKTLNDAFNALVDAAVAGTLNNRAAGVAVLQGVAPTLSDSDGDAWLRSMARLFNGKNSRPGRNSARCAIG